MCKVAEIVLIEHLLQALCLDSCSLLWYAVESSLNGVSNSAFPLQSKVLRDKKIRSMGSVPVALTSRAQ